MIDEDEMRVLQQENEFLRRRCFDLEMGFKTKSGVSSAEVMALRDQLEASKEENEELKRLLADVRLQASDQRNVIQELSLELFEVKLDLRDAEAGAVLCSSLRERNQRLTEHVFALEEARLTSNKTLVDTYIPRRDADAERQMLVHVLECEHRKLRQAMNDMCREKDAFAGKVVQLEEEMQDKENALNEIKRLLESLKTNHKDEVKRCNIRVKGLQKMVCSLHQKLLTLYAELGLNTYDKLHEDVEWFVSTHDFQEEARDELDIGLHINIVPSGCLRHRFGFESIDVNAMIAGHSCPVQMQVTPAPEVGENRPITWRTRVVDFIKLKSK